MSVPGSMADAALRDPLPFLKALIGLRRVIGLYPPSHPVVTQHLSDLGGMVRHVMGSDKEIHIDVINGHVHLNGVSFHDDDAAHARIVGELADLQIDSIHISAGVEVDELRRVAEVLWRVKGQTAEEPLARRLEREQVRHISLGRLVPLDTRRPARQWPDAPTGPLDPAYAEALAQTEQTFAEVTAGLAINPVSVRDLVSLLIHEVARSDVALSQILALKAYENLTYCHSVNVAVLSMMLGAQIGLHDAMLSALVEGALLHDIGKTRIPLEIVKKPGTLDRAERKLIESHTIRGAEILADTDGLHPLTATVALEHHRSITGGGYPDLGAGVIPHPMSQIVSVADVYEALTGARSYQEPRTPEQACLVLARKAGDALNTALVKAFVAAVTFFPVGSLVRTSRGETGVVVRTYPEDPLHPVIVLVHDAASRQQVEIDTSARNDSGQYERHISTTLTPPPDFDLASYLAPAMDPEPQSRHLTARESVH
jgi:putative nucleotidyltransferase with HDIG domain